MGYGIDVMPVWADVRTASAITGVPDNTIRHLYNVGKVGARLMRDKEMGAPKGCAVRFHVADLLAWVRDEALKPKAYALKQLDREVNK